MNKIIFALLASALLLGCVKSDDVSFTGLKSYELNLPSGVNVSLGVENRSGSKLHLRSCDLRVDYRGSTFGKAVLAEPVVVPARFAGDVPVCFRLSLSNPFSALAVMANAQKAIGQMTVSGEIVVKAGMKKKKIKIDNRPVTELMATFGVSF